MKLNSANKTVVPKEDDFDRKWWVVDADEKILGRLATRIADVLRGKNKACFTPYIDCGDFVIVVNAEKVKLTGNKDKKKTYYRHSGYLGGIKETAYERLMSNHPERVIKHAVRGMLPKNRLNRKILKKLKIYTGPEHKHKAQKPEPMNLQ